MALTKSMGVSPSTGGLEARTVSIPPHPGVLPGPERLSIPGPERLSIPGPERLPLPGPERLSIPGPERLPLPGPERLPLPGPEQPGRLPHTSEKQLFRPLWSRPGIRRDL